VISLAYLDRVEENGQARVLAKVPTASRELILSTSRTSWIEAEHDHHTIDAMVALFGLERSIRYWRGALLNLIDKPLLGPFVTGMLRISRSPERVVQVVVTGWPLVYRDMCTPRYEREAEDVVILHFERIEPVVRRYRNYLHCWHGACQALAQLAGVDGRVTFEVSADLSSARARFFWRDRS
jgi:hypothetical protein